MALRPASFAWWVVGVVWLVAVLVMTLTPAPQQAAAVERTAWWCVVCGQAGGADFFQNLLLLIPLGLALGRLGSGRTASLIALAALPLLIESAQAWVIAGRDPALGDVIANAAGGWLGWFWGNGSGRLAPLGRRSRRALAPLVVGLFVAQLVATASLIRPTSAGPSPFTLRASPVTPGAPTYRGQLLGLSLGGEANLIEEGPEVQPAAIGDPLSASFTVTDVAAGSRESVVRIDDARDWSVIAIDLRAGAVAVERRTNSTRLRLRVPTFVTALPPGTTAGDTVNVALTMTRGAVSLSATTPRDSVNITARLGAQHGWILINPFTPLHRLGSEWQWWTRAWLAGWGLLLGLAVAPRPAREGLQWAAVVAIALLAITSYAGATASIIETLAVAVGWLAGGAVARRGAPRGATPP